MAERRARYCGYGRNDTQPQRHPAAFKKKRPPWSYKCSVLDHRSDYSQPPMHHRTLRAPSGTPARAQLCIALGSYTRGVCYGNLAKGHGVNCAPFAHKSQYMRVQRPSECALCMRFEFARPFARLPSALQQRRFEPHQLMVVACAGKFAAPIHHYCGHLGSGEYLEAQLGQLFRKVCQGRGLPTAWPSSEYQSEYVRLPLMRPCSTKTGNSSAACICTR